MSLLVIPTKRNFPRTDEAILDFFTAYFESIPDERWLVGALGKKGGPRCALGHACEIHVSAWPTSNLNRLLGDQASEISDGLHPGYRQPTPRERILAALGDRRRASP